jgi:mono/diheme cytochrome c family protein
MKRLLKGLGFLIGALILFVIAGATFIWFRGIPRYDARIPESVARLNVPRDSAYVARGAKIATLLCNECHRSDDGKLSGRQMKDLPAVFGTVYSMNITQDPVHGIGNWTDGELYYFLRTGIHTDGRWSPPFMPKFPLMADEDLYAVIAWLRSPDPALAADSREYPPNEFNLFTKFLANVAVTPPPLPTGPISIPDTTDKVAFGRYVADALCACYACHSADFAKQDALFPEKSLGYYGGGNPMLNMEQELVPSANITPDRETGIGAWTYQQFYDAVKNGKNPKGGPLYYPMFPHTTLSDTEIAGIWAFLQTVPPVKNAVARYKPK